MTRADNAEKLTCAFSTFVFQIEHLDGMEEERVLHFIILMSNIFKMKIMN